MKTLLGHSWSIVAASVHSGRVSTVRTVALPAWEQGATAASHLPGYAHLRTVIRSSTSADCIVVRGMIPADEFRLLQPGRQLAPVRAACTARPFAGRFFLVRREQS